MNSSRIWLKCRVLELFFCFKSRLDISATIEAVSLGANIHQYVTSGLFLSFCVLDIDLIWIHYIVKSQIITTILLIFVEDICWCLYITSWTQDECDDLLAIVIQNSQVYYILNNIDGLRFYQRVLRESDNLTKNAKSERKSGKIETRSKP